jgi:hypothetical protein
MEGIKLAVAEKQFPIISSTSKKENANTVDFDKLIAVEERRLVRAKEAYLAEIDTIEQYAQNKKSNAKRCF